MSRARLAVAAAVLCLPLMMTVSAEAQLILVCQTPTFWCTMLAPMPVTNHGCWCNTWAGPVFGLSIIPMPPPSLSLHPLPLFPPLRVAYHHP